MKIHNVNNKRKLKKIAYLQYIFQFSNATCLHELPKKRQVEEI